MSLSSRGNVDKSRPRGFGRSGQSSNQHRNSRECTSMRRHGGASHPLYVKRPRNHDKSTTSGPLDDVQPVKKVKTQSGFSDLRHSLVSAAAIAEHIQKNYIDKLHDSKQVHNFLQALSNCQEAIFAELCENHKREVVLVIERMFEMYSTSTPSPQVVIPPAAHEFIIRCEKNGVRKSSWASDLESRDNITEASEEIKKEQEAKDTNAVQVAPVMLFTPRELIKKIAALDPRGRLERMIEMCATIGDLNSCVQKLRYFVISYQNDGEEMDYTACCQLISKLSSKSRRVCEALLRGGSSTDVDSEAKELSKEDALELDEVLDGLLSTTQDVLANRPQSKQHQPISKLTKFVTWCNMHGLLKENGTKYKKIGEDLEQQASLCMQAQATQLETVLLLKALQPGDEKAVKEATDKLWCESKGRYEPCSADVLSSIAVVSGASGISDPLRAQVAQRLVLTQQKLQEERNITQTVLPRRALNFVAAEQSKEKRAAVKRMLAKENITVME
uniref:Uncharacterized protein TCIL3000_11_11490 n=1 Tax=Trypanosoma congolense (strain IL3000) TaxID=1068625 RepID=G0V1Y9_TRYCI|nr:unnamed protein product [Trypanosoma congolense IL3000]